MYCGKCGSKIEEGNSFCPYCGEPVQNQAEPVTNTPVAAKKKSNKTGIIVGVSVAAAVVLVVMGIVFSVVIGSIGRQIMSVNLSSGSGESQYSYADNSQSFEYENTPSSSVEEPGSSYSSSGSISISDFLEQNMSYMKWTKASWQTASDSDKEWSTVVSVYFLLTTNNIPITDSINEHILIQAKGWADIVDSYYVSGDETTEVWEIIANANVIPDLLAAAGVSAQ